MNELNKRKLIEEAYDNGLGAKAEAIAETIYSQLYDGTNQELCEELIEEAYNYVYPSPLEITLDRIAAQHSLETLSKTRVFSDRRFVQFRNECLNLFILESSSNVMNIQNYVLDNFTSLQQIIKAHFNHLNK